MALGKFIYGKSHLGVGLGGLAQWSLNLNVFSRHRMEISRSRQASMRLGFYRWVGGVQVAFPLGRRHVIHPQSGPCPYLACPVPCICLFLSYLPAERSRHRPFLDEASDSGFAHQHLVSAMLCSRWLDDRMWHTKYFVPVSPITSCSDESSPAQARNNVSCLNTRSNQYQHPRVIRINTKQRNRFAGLKRFPLPLLAIDRQENDSCQIALHVI